MLKRGSQSQEWKHMAGPDGQELLRCGMRSSGRPEKGRGCGELGMRMLISAACRTAARGAKGTAIYLLVHIHSLVLVFS